VKATKSEANYHADSHILNRMIILKQHTMNFLITMMHLVEPVKLGMVKCSMGPVGEEVLEEIQDYHMKDYLFHCWETRKPIFGVAMVNQEGIQ